MGSAPDNPSNPDGPGAGSRADDGSVSVPVDELHRLAQIFDATADDVDSALDRLHRNLHSTVLNRHDPDFSTRSVADGTAAIRAVLRPATAQLRADAGLMAATAFEVVESDTTTDGFVVAGDHEPSPAQVDRTAAWIGRVSDGMRQPTPPSIGAADGNDGSNTDPVWDRVSKSL